MHDLLIKLKRCDRLSAAGYKRLKKYNNNYNNKFRVIKNDINLFS